MRKGSIKGEGGLYEKLKIRTLPPKLPRSNILFRILQNFYPFQTQISTRIDNRDLWFQTANVDKLGP